MNQLAVIFRKVGRAVELHLRNRLAVASRNRHIYIRNYMQDNRIVCLVFVMIMPEPVGRPLVNLDIPNPQYTVQLYFGIEKVWAGIGIRQSRIDDFHRLPVGRAKRMKREKLVLPRIM